MKHTRKRKSEYAIPRNAREREDQRDAFAALALMRREGFKAKRAAKAEHTTVKKMRKYLGPALEKRGDDYVARPSDRLTRPLTAIDAKGTRPIVVQSSKAASQVGRYFNAVDDALNGKPSALKKFRGKKIPYNNLKFLTNLKTLRRLKDAGVLDNRDSVRWRAKSAAVREQPSGNQCVLSC